jgi:hypothetical protein
MRACRASRRMSAEDGAWPVSRPARHASRASSRSIVFLQSRCSCFSLEPRRQSTDSRRRVCRGDASRRRRLCWEIATLRATRYTHVESRARPLKVGTESGFTPTVSRCNAGDCHTERVGGGGGAPATLHCSDLSEKSDYFDFRSGFAADEGLGLAFGFGAGNASAVARKSRFSSSLSSRCSPM